VRSLEEKVDGIVEHVADLRVNVARITTSLETHIKRTNLLEARVEQFNKTVQRAQGLGIAVGALGWLIATAAALSEIWRALHGG
jgi:hypothetical protein